ncbi:hypothetical protein J7T55_014890 [Diaporthe amygdali]|uniref:uncharacterized protein n=1 Tax=Phomopsis amygdali TaxID=1214568 RepID=UPI0022FEF293|nr:uncharacterized protein J7T55_014890 [Diaporthe amygdali]KAJ0110087.1 hypothetical protein J7T55_014890 [Diaporthe amygdali]
MPIWPSSPTCLARPRLNAALLSWSRCLSSTARLRTPHTDHFQVPCASAGHVIVSLHDVMKHPVSSPLIINLPPFPVQDIDHVDSYLPAFLHRFPCATIHYRWTNSLENHTSQLEDIETATEAESAEPLPPSTPLHWPTPIHDTLFAYEFLIEHLSPPPNDTTGSRFQRRPVFVYGSYLGASLASSLALTESHTHQPMAIRGLLAFNGIFNWTTMLPDHPNNKLMLDDLLEIDSLDEVDKDVAFMKALMPSHFHQPANLFDPFASPVLFFHTAGMLVPQTFTERSTPNLSQGFVDAVNKLSSPSSTAGAEDPYDRAYVYSDPEDPPPPTPYEDVEADTETEDTNTDTSSSADSGISLSPKPPRKGYVTFPPRASSLKIPDTLLLHTTSPPTPSVPGSVQGQRRRLALWKKLKNAENSFGTQALGLAGLMRRSVNLYELRERVKWDLEFNGWDTEALRRIQVQDVGEADRAAGGFALGRQGEEVASRWLDSRLG